MQGGHNSAEDPLTTCRTPSWTRILAWTLRGPSSSTPRMLTRPPFQWWSLLLASWLAAACAQANVTLLSTASEIVYSPPSCNNSQAAACAGAWQVIPSPDTAGAYITSTNGPTVGSGDLIPQLFLNFQGTGLDIRTSTLSTATINVTLSTQDPTISITREVDSAAGLITVIGLPEDLVTTLSLTYIATAHATRLDISNITIVTPNNDTNPFPSTTLPPPTVIPSFAPTITIVPIIEESQKQTPADIVAEVLGAILGVTLGALGYAAVQFYLRLRRRRRTQTQTPA